MEGWLYEMWRKEQENTCVHLQRGRQPSAKRHRSRTRTPSHPIHISIYCSYFTLSHLDSLLLESPTVCVKWKQIMWPLHGLHCTGLLAWTIGYYKTLISTKLKMVFTNSSRSTLNVTPEVDDPESLLRHPNVQNELSHHTTRASGDTLE